MNWKEYPYLFANGKFDVKITDMIGEEEHEYSIISYKHRPQFFYLTDGWNTADVHVSDCQLIARPIEDMTDEEWYKMYDVKPFEIKVNQKRSVIKSGIKQNRLGFDKALYLLSIGVYPFSDTEDVVFKPGEL